MPVRTILLTLAVLLPACTRPPAPPPLAPLVEEFVKESLAFSPVTASASGMHSHNGTSLDEAIDSYAPEEIARNRQFLDRFEQRIQRDFPTPPPDPQDAADLAIIRGQIRSAKLEFDLLQNYRHNPTVYVELAGGALFNPLVLEYAPLEDRYRHIIARLKRIPALFGQARTQLLDAPEIWNRVAREENDGNRSLITGILAQKCPAALKPAYDEAAKGALAAIESFNAYLKDDLSKRTSDWRLGKDKYAAKFDATLGLGQTPEQALADAEAELARVRGRMQEIAGPLFREMFPGQPLPGGINPLVSRVMSKIAERHATPATYFSDARRDLEEARQFTREKGLMALPSRDNLQVTETPVFLRGIYAVGGFSPAPPLEPKLGAFYWITPVPETWTRERAESKLREYNHYGLKILTIHEAIPGHYLQFEYANDVQPESRRVLRALFFNGPYVEGWAVYATDLLIEQGFLKEDPRMLLTHYKQYLRAVANTILDVRLQTMNMAGEDAVRLMIDQTFQEKEEATAKLQRAQLSSTQLPTYFTGFRAWRRLREKMEQQQGAGFRLAAFHEAALKTGAVPMAELERILNAPK